MTREEAINEIRSWDFLNGKEIEAVQTLIPELAESEDERIRKVIYKLMLGMREEIFTSQDEIVTKEKVLAYLKKQEHKHPEWSEGEMKLLNSIIDDYEKAAKSFCGYDGKIGLLKAIRDGEYNLSKPAERKINEIIDAMNGEHEPGDIYSEDGRLIAKKDESEDERMIRKIESFLSAYGADYFSNDEWREIENWLEKQKESLHISETCKENADSFTDEGERIRKALVWHLKADVDFVSNGVTKAECIAYLEKQKGPENISASTMVPSCWECEQKEQKPSIFPPGLGEVHWNPIPSGKDVHKWNLPEDFEEAVYKVANFISPFNSQEELRKVSHRFAEQLLDIAKKDLQKPAWSEEDEKIMQTMIKEGDLKPSEISWLKSLRPGWKPTEEQMNALNFAITFFMHETNYKNPTELRDLYDDLLKLK